MDSEPSVSRSDEIHHTILAALTVIVGNAQLLHRKLARGEAVEPEVIMRSLKAIERAGNQAVHDLRADG